MTVGETRANTEEGGGGEGEKKMRSEILRALTRGRPWT